MPALRPLEKLSSSGEPVHALLFTYIAAVTWNPTMLGHFLELEKAGKNRSIFLGPRDLSRNCHISISWNCDNSFKLPTCLSAKKNIRSKLQTSCKFSWNFHFCCHNWPSNTSPLDKNLAPALGRTSIRWNMVYLFQCCQAPQALLVLIGELELVAPLLSMCLRWKWDPLFFFFRFAAKTHGFLASKKWCSGKLVFPTWKKRREHGDSFQASSLLTHRKNWRDEMPWIKHAETRIILFETGSKTHLRHLKVFGFFPRFGGWTFSSLPRFLFYCRDIGNGNSSDLMRGLQSFWAKLSISQILFCSCIKPPYVSMMFFVLFFLGDVTFFLVQGIYAQYRQQNHWFQKILLSH